MLPTLTKGGARCQRVFLNSIMTTIRKAKRNIGPVLSEAGAGPSRLVAHIRSGRPFFMISAMRANLSHHENLVRAKKLERMLANLPYSFIRTEGEYLEIGQTEPSPELSLFVMPVDPEAPGAIDRMIFLAVRLMRVFDQDSVLIGDGNRVYLRERDGSEFSLGSAASFSLAVIKRAPAFSKIKGRKFTFADPDDAPGAAVYGQDKSVANQ